jgi:hypothetical protein
MTLNVTTMLLPFDEAVKAIKSMKGKTFFLSLTGTLPTVAAPTERVFSMPVNVKVSRSTVLETLDRLYGPRFQREALVRIQQFDDSRCVFVG